MYDDHVGLWVDYYAAHGQCIDTMCYIQKYSHIDTVPICLLLHAVSVLYYYYNII